MHGYMNKKLLFWSIVVALGGFLFGFDTAVISGAEQKIQQQFEAKRQELSLPIQKKLQAAIQEVAKENGYTYVFPREALLVAPPGDDLANLVKKKLGLKQTTLPPTTTAPEKVKIKTK